MIPASDPDLEPSLKLFDGATDLMCVRDMQGRFVRVNQAWQTTLGLSTDEVCNTPLLPLIHPADVPATLQRMAEADRRHQVVDFVNRYRRRDGQYRDLQWHAQRVGDVILGRARDISTQRLLEEQAQVARVALDETLADIGSRLGAPASAILTTVQALGETELTPRQHALVQTLGRSVVTLEELIAKLVEREREAARAASVPKLDRHRSSAALQITTEPPTAARIQLEQTGTGGDASVGLRTWIVEMAQHVGDNPSFRRGFRDVPSQTLGLFAIRLAHFDQFYPRQLQAVSVASGLMSANRAFALLARLQDVGFIEVAARLRSGRIRPYRIEPAMTQSFAALLEIDLKSLARTDYRAVLALEAIRADEGKAIPLLASFAAAVLDDLRSGGDGLTKRLNGVSLMARGQTVALAIAADALARNGTTGEGWIGISLTDYAQRFDVSRVQVRRIIESLEGCGLRRDPASPSRLLVTERFIEAIESVRRASCDLLAIALSRVI
jgi:PAS domain S-box-containing protein